MLEPAFDVAFLDYNLDGVSGEYVVQAIALTNIKKPKFIVIHSNDPFGARKMSNILLSYNYHNFVECSFGDYQEWQNLLKFLVANNKTNAWPGPC